MPYGDNSMSHNRFGGCTSPDHKLRWAQSFAAPPAHFPEPLMISRAAVLVLTAALTTTLVACTDSSTTGPNARSVVALSSGSTAAGGGGGAGGSVRPCAILSYAIQNDIVNKLVIPSFWQPNNYYQAFAAGITEKSCDTIAGATIAMTDITGVDDGCNVVLSPWVNNPAYLNPKYGAKPMHAFQESFIYATGASCIGVERTLQATLTDPSPGGKVSSVTLKWTP